MESTQSVHRVLKALKNVLRVTLSLYKLSLTLIIKKLKMPKSTQFGPKNTVDQIDGTGPIISITRGPREAGLAPLSLSSARTPGRTGSVSTYSNF